MSKGSRDSGNADAKAIAAGEMDAVEALATEGKDEADSANEKKGRGRSGKPGAAKKSAPVVTVKKTPGKK